MILNLLIIPAYNLLEGIVDSCRDKVTPKIGSIIYCDLAFGYMEHSGVYIGDNKIVHLSGKGRIEVVSAKEFISGTTACNIYVSCRDSQSVGSANVAQRALSQVGQHRNYNFILDNCHQFTAGCLSGCFNNSCNFLWMLKNESKKNIFSDSWNHWDIELFT